MLRSYISNFYSINVKSYFARLLRRRIKSERSTIYSSYDAIAIDCNIKLNNVTKIVITSNITLTATNLTRLKTSLISFISDIHDILNNDLK